MRILFLHPNFPGQFLNVASFLGQDTANEVVFLTQRKENELPGVRKVLFQDPIYQSHGTHSYVLPVEKALMQGEEVCMKALELKKNGFKPDIVCGHSGWGSTMFMKDVFPQAAFVGYFEWYTNSFGGCLDFDPNDSLKLDTAFAARISNIPLLTDLYSCDAGISPTYWQKKQFPQEYHSKIEVIHDGIDINYFRPKKDVERIFPEIGLDFTNISEVVTYVSRGMESWRGFPQFMEAVSILQKKRPNCHVVIVGGDHIAYGSKKPPEGKSYKQWMLEKLDLDLSRVHFTGMLPYYLYKKILQISSVHVYLTFPYVLSWSMLEAMAVGCILVASDTPPVREVIVDQENGFLVNFFSSTELAHKIEMVLKNKNDFNEIGERARDTIQQKYELTKQVKLQCKLFEKMCLEM